MLRNLLSRGQTPAVLPWYERDGGARLHQDQDAIAHTYPGLSFRIDETKKQCTLTGEIVHRAECGIPTPIAVQIQLPWAYPKSEPLVYEVGGRFERTQDRHFYPDGCCCLWLSEESRWNPLDPEGLRAFLDELMVFFDRQLVYDALPASEKKWPGPERGHGVNGYWEYALEMVGGDDLFLQESLLLIGEGLGKVRNLKCPCGSGVKTKRCHRVKIERLARCVPQKWLHALVRHARNRKAQSI